MKRTISWIRRSMGRGTRALRGFLTGFTGVKANTSTVGDGGEAKVARNARRPFCC